MDLRMSKIVGMRMRKMVWMRMKEDGWPGWDEDVRMVCKFCCKLFPGLGQTTIDSGKDSP